MASQIPSIKVPERIARSPGEVAPEFRDLWRDLVGVFPVGNAFPVRDPVSGLILTPNANAEITPSPFGPIAGVYSATNERYINATTPDAFQIGLPFTFGVLIKPTASSDGNDGRIFGVQYSDPFGAPYSSYTIMHRGGSRIQMEINSGGFAKEVKADSYMDDYIGEWRAIVGVATADGGQIYVDGILSANVSASWVDPTYDASSIMGYGDMTGGGNSCHAVADSAFVSDREWTPQEIETWSQNPTGLYTKTTPFSVFFGPGVARADGSLTDGSETVSGVASAVPTATGSLTDGSETLSGTMFAVPGADGSVTDGGETLSGDADFQIIADGSLTEGGETVSGVADTVPVIESGNVTDGGETLSGSSLMTVIVDGSLSEGDETLSGTALDVPYIDGGITEGGETLSGTALDVPYIEGGLTEGGESFSGDADFQLLTSANITDGSEEIEGIVTNSVGDDKAHLRSDLNGNVIPFRANSLSVSTRMNACDDASFSLFLRAGEDNPIQIGEPLTLYADERQEEKVWSGTVDRYSETDMVGAKNYTRIVKFRCVCHSAIADRYHVSAAYQNETAGDIIKDVLDQYLSQEGVTEGTIQDGPTIEQANFNYKPVSTVLNDLCDESGFSWWIDPDKKLNFQSRATTLGEMEINSSSRDFRTFKIDRGRREYRNRQVVRGGKGYTSERTETFKGDDEQKTFSVAFPIGKKPTIKVDGVDQDVGIRGLDEDSDWYWNKEKNEVSQDEDATALASGSTLTVTYIGLVPIAVESSDRGAINQRKNVEGGAGIYEHVISDSSIEKEESALNRAEALLRRFARIEEKISFETDDLTVRQGQLLDITLTDRDVEGQYLLDEVSFKVKDNNRLRASVSALNGEAFGSWTKYFRELTKAKQEFTVRENEKVLLQRRASETQTLFEQVNTSEGTAEAFIVGEDGEPAGSGTSIIGYNRLGNVTHEENTESETASVSSSVSSSTNSTLTTTIGSDEIGFTVIG